MHPSAVPWTLMKDISRTDILLLLANLWLFLLVASAYFGWD